MTARYWTVAFTETVREMQERLGSPAAYRARETEPDALGEDEVAFIRSRDGLYMATVSETGWPYMQHRGGRPGFLRVTGPRTLVMPDYRGNRQYVSLGNLAGNDRAALFLMDYPRRARLKLYVRVAVTEDADALAALASHDPTARVERAMRFTVEAFDWNCPQHIVPRYTEEDVAALIARMGARIAALEAQVAALTREDGVGEGPAAPSRSESPPST